jgi:hypothetical protein
MDATLPYIYMVRRRVATHRIRLRQAEAARRGAGARVTCGHAGHEPMNFFFCLSLSPRQQQAAGRQQALLQPNTGGRRPAPTGHRATAPTPGQQMPRTDALPLDGDKGQESDSDASHPLPLPAMPLRSPALLLLPVALQCSQASCNRRTTTYSAPYLHGLYCCSSTVCSTWARTSDTSLVLVFFLSFVTNVHNTHAHPPLFTRT